ncbi:hypothetical protein [Emcibacter nanhaiensis]|uniref:Twin-arginine translocation signal domain-containing protein n=1 Tax=Emcibacter nanhaiensis TaxID=1505037 RepID=A0A501PCT7_9PROT|nr:hypothetical protein [Emcibacter nanhaiensis]TPD57861.1 hypothetical protein FIV46_17335 [Emcibacter nanhaiensis]
MNITRRNLMAGAGMAGMAVALGPAARSLAGTAGEKARLAVYDSRLPKSRQFAREMTAQGLKTLDIAGEDAVLWRTVRRLARSSGDVIGLTRWSDLVLVRGFLEEGGRRMSRRAAPQQLRTGNISTFLWRMDSARASA